MGGGGGFVIPTAPVAHPPPRWRRQPQQRLKEENPNGSKTPRRSALLLLSLTAAAAPSPALSLGFSGPKEWLRDQKKKASRFVLAPIEASRKSLRAAFLLMEDSALTSESSEEVHNLLNSASRDCVPQMRSSIVGFQARTGVEVCTFRLIVRNAASLLDKSDPVKLEAEAMLDDLIRSFSELGSVIDNTDFQLNTDRGVGVAPHEHLEVQATKGTRYGSSKDGAGTCSMHHQEMQSDLTELEQEATRSCWREDQKGGAPFKATATCSSKKKKGGGHPSCTSSILRRRGRL